MLVKNGMGRPKRIMIKLPLVVLDKICARSAGMVRSESDSKRSSEMMSVKSSVWPIGMLVRAVLIQKISIAGKTEQPSKVQPMGYLK